jgi:DNA ligase D-like protein (predicted polymerase)
VAGRQVRVSNPDKVFFPALGLTKMDLVEHYLMVGEGALRNVGMRPTVMKRFPNGADEDFFFQKRVPESRPDWLQTATVAFPSGRTATELCPADLAHIVWAVNLGCIDLNPWAVRRWDLDHPDELRVDLDPQPGVPFDAVRRVAGCVNDVLTEHGLVGWPKTSGSRGIHVNVRIVARWGFTEVRRAVLAMAREVERRMPDIATTAWWKEQRGERVLLDYNQNARDRTVASAYSVRPNPQALVSAPFTWDELDGVELEAFSVASMPDRYRAVGDLTEGIDEAVGSLSGLLELAARDEGDGLGDAPWPPNFPKAPTEPKRVEPSRARGE